MGNTMQVLEIVSLTPRMPSPPAEMVGYCYSAAATPLSVTGPFLWGGSAYLAADNSIQVTGFSKHRLATKGSTGGRVVVWGKVLLHTDIFPLPSETERGIGPHRQPNDLPLRRRTSARLLSSIKES